MEKISSEHKPCTYCSNDALPHTDPPVCAEHLNVKTASAELSSLKELSAADGSTRNEGHA